MLAVLSVGQLARLVGELVLTMVDEWVDLTVAMLVDWKAEPMEAT